MMKIYYRQSPVQNSTFFTNSPDPWIQCLRLQYLFPTSQNSALSLLLVEFVASFQISHIVPLLLDGNVNKYEFKREEGLYSENQR
jgi:hypothetical protein